jgi:adenylate kinase family enzyme
MRRILLIGPGCSGKSTLAAQIGDITGLRVIHLDALYWRPGWIPTPEAEWRRTVASLAAEHEWVMDGNYGGTLDLRLAHCDTVVFLDVPRLVCISRVIRRSLSLLRSAAARYGAGLSGANHMAVSRLDLDLSAAPAPRRVA